MTDVQGVRIGIVGLGTIGQIHASRLDELGASLVGADVDEDARAAFEAEFDAATYADHHELLESGVDAVVVGVPNRIHEEIATDALAAGVDVLLEKPLAHSLESAERVATAARKSDGRCTVGFTMRFSGAAKRALELRDAGELGSLTHVNVNYLRHGGVPGGGRGWFTDESLAGGGVLMDLGVHIIDLALHLHDYPTIIEVSGQIHSTFGEYTVDDSATAYLRCADGRTISIETAWHGTARPSRDCVVRGTKGALEFAVSGSELTYVGDNADEPETIAVEPGDMYLEEGRAFIEAVTGMGERFRTLDDALVVQRVLDAIYESSNTGRAVRLEHHDAVE